MSKRVIAAPVTRLTLQQLVRATPSSIVARATSQCHLLRRQYALGSLDGFRRQYGKDRTQYNEMRAWVMGTTHKRNCYLRFFGPPALTTQVWAWCSCEYFTYFLEVCMARYNSSTIRNSNGMIPVVRNKRMVPHLCKHILIAAKYAVQEKKDLVQEELDRQAEEQEKLVGKKAASVAYPGRGLQIPRGRFTHPADKPTGLVDL
jgi:hypothetical protein